MSLANKTLFVTGASRGIGLAIALRAARDGANIAIAAKTVKPDPRLPGTIFTAAEEIEKAGGKALPLPCDIRDEQSVEKAVAETVAKFGGIDILVNNASAISLTGTLQTPMKRYDLMHQINARGTFLVSQKCIPHLLKAANPHVLNLSPPLDFDVKWFANHPAYTLAKYSMSVYAWAMAEEFKGKIAFNCLWPRTGIATAAIQNVLGGDDGMKRCRKPEIMADAAHAILNRPAQGLHRQLLHRRRGAGGRGRHRLRPVRRLARHAADARLLRARARRAHRRRPELTRHGDVHPGPWRVPRRLVLGEGRSRSSRATATRSARPTCPAWARTTRRRPTSPWPTMSRRSRRLLDKMEEPVVLVGHALGGVTISQTAEARRRKIKALVYVCGLMPPSGKASREMTAGDPDMLFRRSREVSPDGLTYTFARASCRRCSTRTSRPRTATAPWSGCGRSRSRSRPRRSR